MMRKLVSVVFVVVLMTATPFWSVAQNASPAAGTPPAGPKPPELCSGTEITKGETGIVVEPPGMEAGVVALPTPANGFLWVVEVTILPDSCYPFHAYDGPVVLFVHSGSIEYAVHSETVPPATVTKGHQDDTTTLMTVPSPSFQWDEFVTLNSGYWVTQDRAAYFTYRNPGPGSAVVAVAAYMGSPDPLQSSGKKG